MPIAARPSALFAGPAPRGPLSFKDWAWAQLQASLQAKLLPTLPKEQQFAPWFTSSLSHYATSAPAAFHRDLGNLIDALLQPGPLTPLKHVIEAPRGSAKSVYLALGLPLLGLLLGRFRYVIIASDSRAQANKHVKAMGLELARGSLLKDLPAAPTLRASAAGTLQLSNGALVESLGAGMQLRGRRIGEARPDLIVVDDPDSQEAVYSETERAHRREWFFGSVLEAGHAGTVIVVDGTRLHRECLTAHLSKTPGWRHHLYRSVLAWPRRMDLWAEWERLYGDLGFSAQERERKADAFYREHQAALLDGAEVLWPARFSLLHLMKQRASLTHPVFEAEHQNNPVSAEACEWPPELFPSPHAQDPRWYEELPVGMEPELVLMAMDPSKKSMDRPSDYCAIVTLRKYGGQYLIDADLQRRTVAECHQAFSSLARRHKPHASVIESVMFQELFATHLAQEFAKDGLPPPIPLPQKENKLLRIRRLDPWLRGNVLRWCRRSPGVQLLLEQLMQFPGGRHDDGPDALEMVLRLMVLYVSARREG